MSRKYAIVTGASSGIGNSTAKDLIDSKKYFVYCLSRNIEGMKNLKSRNSKIIHLDLNNIKSIEKVFLKIIKECKNIDLLINNAGYGLPGPIECIDIQDAKKCFNVNVFAPAYLMQLAMTNMRKNNKGLIINVGSVVSKFSVPFSAWYSASKHSLLSLSESAQMELKSINSNVRIVCLNPGLIKTNFSKAAKDVFNKLKFINSKEYEGKLNEIRKQRGQMSDKGSPPEIVSKFIIKIIDIKNPNFSYHVGKYSNICLFLRKILPDKLFYWYWLAYDFRK